MNTMMEVNTRPPQVMVRGEGSWIFDDADKRYLDFVQGWAVNALGHSPKELADALREQGATLLAPSPAYHNKWALGLCDRLVHAAGLSQAFLANSGAEANECAIKLARKFGKLHRGGAFRVITTHNAFHGRTLTTMSASGKPGWDEMFPPRMEGFTKVPYGDLEAMDDAMDDETCAVMLEPIQGEAGVIVPPEGYLKSVRELATRRGVLLVLDEIQTGMGRTGRLFRFQSEGVCPDIMTLGKGLGGGVPLGAVVATKSASCFGHGEHGGTYCGNPLMARCGAAVFDVVSEPSFLHNVLERGEQLQAGLRKLSVPAGSIRTVRGAGLLVAATLATPKGAAVVERAFELGLLLNAPRPDTLRFMPSLRVDASEIAQMLDVLERALRETS